MKLYYSRGACSLAAHIALYEAGLAFRAEPVDLKAKTLAGGADFRQVNPLGYVPVLELDGGERLTEVGVVLQYIADQKPETSLAPPAGTMPRYRLMQWLAFISSELHKTFSPLFAPHTPEDYKPVIRERLAQRLAYMNQQLAASSFLMGEQFTVADAYLFVVLNWAGVMNLDLTPYAHLQSFQKRVGARPGVQRALQAEGLLGS
ncbi:glutathione S-transferase [Steroidobacter denitrificans]|uniref:Glutathione S-transferase n=1 Tax=Steroidobacter denitrificans TaxID=465721 RepID=A0A127FBP5_STEDE|nr:glutathione transferase GstA [Steroidobacter denitrificans]AMN47836.1 glutathione S-transferase [Steroidobacter denitrificans]